MSAHFFETAARSAIGLVRQGNEDSGFVSAQLIAVADGMGGHAAGEVASAIAVRTLEESAKVFTHPDIDEESADDLFLQSIQSAESALKSAVDDNPELSGMGTTLTSLFLRGNSVALLHIGDSRCYRIKKEKVEQLSHDHTVIQELIDQGRLSEDEIANHPQRSLLTQVLMGSGSIHPMLLVKDVKVGDKFLLCSDGLSSVLSELEINKIIKAGGDLLGNLLAAVRERGAPDNVTIILSEVVDLIQATELEKFGAARV